MKKYRTTIHIIYDSKELLFEKMPDYEGLYISPHGNLVFESKKPLSTEKLRRILNTIVGTENIALYDGTELVMKTVLVKQIIVFINTTAHAINFKMSSEPMDYVLGLKVYPKTKFINGKHHLFVKSSRRQYYKNIESIYNVIYDFYNFRRLENEK